MARKPHTSFIQRCKPILETSIQTEMSRTEKCESKLKALINLYRLANSVAQVVLNLPGLAKKLHDSGMVSNPNELHAFGRAFGLAQPLISFVDVGSAKSVQITGFVRL